MRSSSKNTVFQMLQESRKTMLHVYYLNMDKWANTSLQKKAPNVNIGQDEANKVMQKLCKLFIFIRRLGVIPVGISFFCWLQNCFSLFPRVYLLPQISGMERNSNWPNLNMVKEAAGSQMLMPRSWLDCFRLDGLWPEKGKSSVPVTDPEKSVPSNWPREISSQ